MKRLLNFVVVASLIMGTWVFAQSPEFEATYRTTLKEFSIFHPQKYFIDSQLGSDSNSGLSDSQAWETIAPLETTILFPGDSVFFKCGSEWSNGLNIDYSGMENFPIVFTSYGSGTSPIFEDSLNKVVIIDADWIVFENITVRNGKTGILIRDYSENNIIQNVEIYDVETGIWIDGKRSTVTRCYIHHCISQNPLNIGRGIDLHNRNCEISYVVFTEIKSLDSSLNANTIEAYGYVDSAYIHHNYIYNTKGFMEIGADSSLGSAFFMNISYNILMNNNKRFLTIHTGGEYQTYIENIEVHNNTIVDTLYRYSWKNAIISFPDATGQHNELKIFNNIFYLDYVWRVYSLNNTNILHDNNIYHLLDNTLKVGISCNSNELQTNPLFINISANDLHLSSSSPAIDAGINLGYTEDYEGNLVPQGLFPDIGAYEYVSHTEISLDLKAFLQGAYRLEQNYPNPFNPTTVISYQLPVSSIVQLKIYNLLGQEIAILVNEEKLAGRYEVKFNSENLSSGTYFYKLTAGNFSETKKMILMK